MNIDDFDIKRLSLTEGDTLVVRVPRKNLPGHKWMEYADGIRAAFRSHFSTNNVIVLDKDIEIEIVNKGEVNEL